MTFNEFHTAVNLELDKTASFSLPSFEPDELDYWINKSIERYVKTKYSGNNVKRESLEQTQKVTDDIGVLIRDELLGQVGIANGQVNVNGVNYVALPNCAYFELPYNYMFSIDEGLTALSYYDCKGVERRISGIVNVKPISSDIYSTKSKDPFSQHVLTLDYCEPMRLIKGRLIEVVLDVSSKVFLRPVEDKYYIRYVAHPQSVHSISGGVITWCNSTDSTFITTQCSLALHTHQEICNITANMILENIESGRYQANTIETIKNY